jgi:hypothetical protein
MGARRHGPASPFVASHSQPGKRQLPRGSYKPCGGFVTEPAFTCCWVGPVGRHTATGPAAARRPRLAAFSFIGWLPWAARSICGEIGGGIEGFAQLFQPLNEQFPANGSPVGTTGKL